MTFDDSYFGLPEDPELAFVQIEKELRDQLEIKVDNGNNDSPYFDWYQDYMNSVIGAAQGLGISEFDFFSVPYNRNNYYDDYRKLALAVDNFKIRVRVRYSRYSKKYSVALDSKAREKLRHHLTQMKSFIDTLDLSQNKRDAIMAKIIDLEAEIERDRTRFEVFAAFVLETTGLAGRAAENLEPLRKWIDPITKVFGNAKEDEAARPNLPPPHKPKRIEPPKQKLPPSSADSLEDDIPF